MKSKIKLNHSKCDECGHTCRNHSLILFKGRKLCHICRMKDPSYKMNSEFYNAYIRKSGRYKKSLTDTLLKRYKIHTSVDKNGYLHCYLKVPSCLSGKYVKLSLVI